MGSHIYLRNTNCSSLETKIKTKRSILIFRTTKRKTEKNRSRFRDREKKKKNHFKHNTVYSIYIEIIDKSAENRDDPTIF